MTKPFTDDLDYQRTETPRDPTDDLELKRAVIKLTALVGRLGAEVQAQEKEIADLRAALVRLDEQINTGRAK